MAHQKKLLLFMTLIFIALNCSGKPLIPSEVIYTTDQLEFSPRDQKLIIDYMVQTIERSPFILGKNDQKTQGNWILGPLINDTDEHINTNYIMQSIRNQLIDNNIATFLSVTIKETDDLKAIQKKSGKAKAQYLLKGYMSNIRKYKKNVSFQIILQIVDLTVSEIVWTKTFIINKIFKIKDSHRFR
ncbi:MAG TPA: hypothetical protein ENI73_01920 [Spirochaetes bacterium]|nr:hypothetical protein [Spirochaetota bacterium]